MIKAFYGGEWHHVNILDVEYVNDEPYCFKFRENGKVFFIEASKVEAFW